MRTPYDDAMPEPGSAENTTHWVRWHEAYEDPESALSLRLRLVQDGVPLYDVQALLGRESYETTQRYAHLAPRRSQ